MLTIKNSWKPVRKDWLKRTGVGAGASNAFGGCSVARCWSQEKQGETRENKPEQSSTHRNKSYFRRGVGSFSRRGGAGYRATQVRPAVPPSPPASAFAQEQLRRDKTARQGRFPAAGRPGFPTHFHPYFFQRPGGVGRAYEVDAQTRGQYRAKSGRKGLFPRQIPKGVRKEWAARSPGSLFPVRIGGVERGGFSLSLHRFPPLMGGCPPIFFAGRYFVKLDLRGKN
jgi:hypothetical protein